MCDWSLEQPDDCPRPHPACTHPHNCRPSTVLMANTTAPVSPSPVSLNASTTFPSAAGKPTIFLRRFIHLLACFRCASWAHPFAGLFKVDGPGTGTTPDSTVGANTSQHTANLRPLSRVTSHWARERGRRIGTGAAEQGAWSGETAALTKLGEVDTRPLLSRHSTRHERHHAPGTPPLPTPPTEHTRTHTRTRLFLFVLTSLRYTRR